MTARYKNITATSVYNIRTNLSNISTLYNRVFDQYFSSFKKMKVSGFYENEKVLRM